MLLQLLLDGLLALLQLLAHHYLLPLRESLLQQQHRLLLGQLYLAEVEIALDRLKVVVGGRVRVLYVAGGVVELGGWPVFGRIIDHLLGVVVLAHEFELIKRSIKLWLGGPGLELLRREKELFIARIVEIWDSRVVILLVVELLW